MAQRIALNGDGVLLRVAAHAEAVFVEKLHPNGSLLRIGVEQNLLAVFEFERLQGDLPDVLERLSQRGLSALRNGADAGEAIARDARHADAAALVRRFELAARQRSHAVGAIVEMDLVLQD